MIELVWPQISTHQSPDEYRTSGWHSFSSFGGFELAQFLYKRIHILGCIGEKSMNNASEMNDTKPSIQLRDNHHHNIQWSHHYQHFHLHLCTVQHHEQQNQDDVLLRIEKWWPMEHPQWPNIDGGMSHEIITIQSIDQSIIHQWVLTSSTHLQCLTHSARSFMVITVGPLNLLVSASLHTPTTKMALGTTFLACSSARVCPKWKRSKIPSAKVWWSSC